MTESLPHSSPPPGALREVSTLFLRLGTTAFGGPAAHIAMMHDEVVTRKKWLTDQEFLDLNGATNLIPGPNSTEIATDTGLPKHQVSAYMDRLQDLRMIERRLPITVLPAKRSRSHKGRYHLSDHYHRFHFRFIDPNLDLLEQGRVEQVWEKIGEQFRAFIGATAFEEICREWVWLQADRGKLPFKPDNVGSHWGRGIQIDVVAIHWSERWLLLGECKWSVDRISAQMVKEFAEKTQRFAEKEFPGWNVHRLFFARGGFTEAAQTESKRAGIGLVELKELEQ